MKRNYILRTFWILTGTLGGLFLFLCIYPVKTATLVSRPRPAGTFQESLARFEGIRRKEQKDIVPAGQTILLHHGVRTGRVIVFFHGFTNSPRQFRELAELFYRAGYNVYIPRVPHHGLKASGPADLERLTAEDLVTTSDEAVDLARGLGDAVTVAGISMGGVMAGWVAQMRDDVDRIALIAPNFGTYKVPACFLKPSINFLLLRPNSFVWWDAGKKQNLVVPETAYFGFPSRALGEIRRLGWYVQSLGVRSRPRARSILIVTNANDRAVSKEGIDAVVRNWQKHDASQVETYDFPKALGLGHDLIDPQQPGQNTALVYPRLLGLITNEKRTEERGMPHVGEMAGRE